MRFIGIIPARYGSSRFPGKPLALIGGMPMIERVYRQASLALDTVMVATDDERIYDCVKAFGGEVVMTRTDHTCGTERCLEAWERYRALMHDASSLNDHDTVIINIQGDEPFIQPEQIEAIRSCFADDDDTPIATLVKPFTEQDSLSDLENPNTPKVVFSDIDHHALLFSRSVIPYLRGIDKSEWLRQHKHYKHIGMYAYRADVLAAITRLPHSRAEEAESLEQLRWLENGYRIRVAVTHVASIGIDTPDDLQKAEDFLKKRNLDV